MDGYFRRKQSRRFGSETFVHQRAVIKDIEAAVKSALASKYRNAGQTCVLRVPHLRPGYDLRRVCREAIAGGKARFNSRNEALWKVFLVKS